MKKSCLFLIIFLISLSTSSFGSEISFGGGLWPFYFNNNNTTTILSPFIQFKKDNFIFRPLFSYNKRDNGDYKFNFLYPFVEFSKRGNVVKKRIFPIFNKTYRTDKHSNENFTNLFPFFWGETCDNKSYGGMFPFYGRLLNKFHYNEINFYMWPIYYTKKRENNKDYHFLWPFFGFGKGNNYSALKIWPLFGFKEEKGKLNSRFFLWPFFIFQDKKYDTWIHKRIYFPFYIHSYSTNYDYKTFLFPFFRFNRRGDSYKYLGFPWPFFTIERSGKYFDFSLFPLIHHVYKERYEKYSLLWILIRNEKIFSKEHFLNKEKMSFLLINRFENDFKNNRKYSNIWPFYEYYQDGNDYIFKFFEPFPFKIPAVYNLYSTFFNIFYIEKHDNIKRISFLWGLFSYKSSPEESCFSLFKIIDFCSDNTIREAFSNEEWNLLLNIGM